MIVLLVQLNPLLPKLASAAVLQYSLACIVVLPPLCLFSRKLLVVSTFMEESLVEIMPLKHAKALMAIGQIETSEANEFFISAGEIPQKLGFVFSGLFRYVYYQ